MSFNKPLTERQDMSTEEKKLFNCPDCGHEVEALPSSMQAGSQVVCPRCGTCREASDWTDPQPEEQDWEQMYNDLLEEVQEMRADMEEVNQSMSGQGLNERNKYMILALIGDTLEEGDNAIDKLVSEAVRIKRENRLLRKKVNALAISDDVKTVTKQYGWCMKRLHEYAAMHEGWSPMHGWDTPPMPSQSDMSIRLHEYANTYEGWEPDSVWGLPPKPTPSDTNNTLGVDPVQYDRLVTKYNTIVCSIYKYIECTHECSEAGAYVRELAELCHGPDADVNAKGSVQYDEVNAKDVHQEMRELHEAADIGDQARLYYYMSEISEELCCAAWMNDLEYNLWDAVINGPRGYGMYVHGYIAQTNIDIMKRLSDSIEGWMIFDTEGKCDLKYIPMKQWLVMYDDHMNGGSGPDADVNANDPVVLGVSSRGIDVDRYRREDSGHA